MIALQENDEPFLKLKENINSSMNQLQSIGVKHIRLGLEQGKLREINYSGQSHQLMQNTDFTTL